MAKLLKDERKVFVAQRIYDESVDNWLKMMDMLNSEIMEIYDILQGYSKGLKDERYQISSQQYSALKDQFNLWKANLREPDKVLENIEDELRKKHKRRQSEKNPKTPDAPSATGIPKVAVFRTSAQ